MNKAEPVSKWRVIGWSSCALLLSIPLITRAPWSALDFVLAAAMLVASGIALELVARSRKNLTELAAAAGALLGALVIVWVNGAVGMIGSEDNPYNLLFLIVILIAAGGSVIARFRLTGLAITMAMAGFSQLLIAAGGMQEDTRGAIFAGLTSLPWFASALLFQLRARHRSEHAT
jgi:hypothetical protein